MEPFPTMTSRNRVALVLGTFLLAGSAALALKALSPAEAAFADLHPGRTAQPAEDGFLHHGGHIHPGTRRSLGTATVGGTEIVVHRIGAIGDLATFEVETDGPARLTAWIAAGSDVLAPPTQVSVGTHVHLAADPARNLTLWIEVETASGRHAVEFFVE